MPIYLWHSTCESRPHNGQGKVGVSVDSKGYRVFVCNKNSCPNRLICLVLKVYNSSSDLDKVSPKVTHNGMYSIHVILKILLKSSLSGSTKENDKKIY